MHVPQVRSIRHDRQAGRSVCPRAEHHQREDLRHSLVLVRLPRPRHRPLLRLPGGHHQHARPQEEPRREEGHWEQQRPRQTSRRKSQYWRLVHDLPHLEEP